MNNMKKMTKAEIREFNSKVEYNESVVSWVVDLISCAIFFPMIVMFMGVFIKKLEPKI